MRTVVWAAVNTMDRIQAEDNMRLVMLTLTYAETDGWGARDIRRATKWVKRHGSTGYVWVAELQKRGAVHYHLLTLWPKGARWIKPSDKKGGWGQGFTWVTDDVQYPSYILKYISKGVENDGRNVYPKGLRMYGVSQSVISRMSYTHRLAFRGCQLPSWYREGEKDGSIVLGSYRTGGGVDYRGSVTPSPYAEYHLLAVDHAMIMQYDGVDMYFDISQG